MNHRIQLKIDEFKRLASNHREQSTPSRSVRSQEDSLATVIRSKKDADEFMSELESIVKRSK